jgi:transposase-like protein
VLSLYAKGLTTGEISAHFAEIYGASVSKETISRITDKVVAEMTDWCNRPLDEVCAAVFIDAVMVKVRDGQVASRPIYAAIGVTLRGEKDILGLWAGTGGEGAKFWMSVLTDLRNRGVKDVFFVVCDGLKGLPEVVGNAWPAAIVQTCIVHYPDLRVMPTGGADVLAGFVNPKWDLGSGPHFVMVSAPARVGWLDPPQRRNLQASVPAESSVGKSSHSGRRPC